MGESRGGWEAGHQITYVWNLNYDTNEQIYEIDVTTKTRNKQLYTHLIILREFHNTKNV